MINKTVGVRIQLKDKRQALAQIGGIMKITEMTEKFFGTELYGPHQRFRIGVFCRKKNLFHRIGIHQGLDKVKFLFNVLSQFKDQ